MEEDNVFTGVCHSVQGGVCPEGSVSGGGFWCSGVCCARDGEVVGPERGDCVSTGGFVQGGGVQWGGCSPGGLHTPPLPEIRRNTVNRRSVRILLECILVWKYLRS